MNKKNINADKIKTIYELCLEFYKYETFINYKHLENLNGFLFDKDSIDKIKESICYEKVKSDLKNKQPDKEIKDILKKNYKNKEIKKITPIKFKNSQELIKELNNNKKYYLINNELTTKINKAEKYIKYSIEYKIN